MNDDDDDEPAVAVDADEPNLVTDDGGDAAAALDLAAALGFATEADAYARR